MSANQVMGLAFITFSLALMVVNITNAFLYSPYAIGLVPINLGTMLFGFWLLRVSRER